MTGPWVVEVTRGDVVESVHRVTVVVLDPDGTVVTAAGDVERPVYGRSALKPAQTVAVLEHLADAHLADTPGRGALTDAEVALASGSHSGEAVHLGLVRGLLARHGQPEDALQCPPDLPLGVDAARARMAAGGAAAPVTMNCSGKHAAMLAATGGDPGYLRADHPLQRRVRAVVERTAGPVLAASVDGCGAPALATSTLALARLGRTLAAAPPGSKEHRVATAMRARPELVAGTGRLDTVLMTALPGAIAKSGAEGVLVAALPDGTALAVKVDDGQMRAVGPVLLEVVRRVGLDLPPRLAAVAAPPVLGGGEPVGELRAQR